MLNGNNNNDIQRYTCKLYVHKPYVQSVSHVCSLTVEGT